MGNRLMKLLCDVRLKYCVKYIPPSVVFLFCFSSSCVPYVASFSGLSILDDLFGIIKRLFNMMNCFLCYTPVNDY
jgi:hypothetical protein